MRYLVVLTLAVSIILFIYDRSYTEKPQKIQYRYLPRTWYHQIKDDALTKDEVISQMYDEVNGNVWLQMYQAGKLV